MAGRQRTCNALRQARVSIEALFSNGFCDCLHCTREILHFLASSLKPSTNETTLHLNSSASFDNHHSLSTKCRDLRLGRKLHTRSEPETKIGKILAVCWQEEKLAANCHACRQTCPFLTCSSVPASKIQFFPEFILCYFFDLVIFDLFGACLDILSIFLSFLTLRDTRPDAL